ncbi:valine--tRNA ligase [Cereibacter sphaeroides]|uniref:valine--tRNA ligase n=3 Tax=Cereibacter sphaeroides TaxID=1063 RepID=UPI001F211997|nr:valine--tRNA ligase [Cereibacter sphaeroides]MCE6958166.1 valine--tRNA ligase [Cereibacter sphaeroides]MCE6968025.1 valine--tRNA ligase [Cereibacter sphaeroides]
MPMDKTFNAAEAEARLYAQWEKAGAFKAGANASRPETFCIMIPPPNVTGSLHMGHAFNNTLQDILTRWHRMRGFDTLWQPGQDHAGIATQMVVERDLAKAGHPSRREMGREAFLAKVWEWKEQSGGTIINQLKRLGASCDWSRNAFTMDANFQRAVLKVFVDLYEKGFIYRGKRLVNWDPHFETAISDLEVEQVEMNGNMWRLRYRLADGATYRHPVTFDETDTPIDWEERDYLTVATTRPETMLGDTGIAVNPADDRYAHLIGKEVILPLVGRRIPIVADDYADPTKGTGAVKITPAHDFNDWGVGQRTGLRAINVMTGRATMFLAENPDFLEGCEPEDVVFALDGLDRYEARTRIVALAEEQGWLDGIDSDRHMVPHGDRSKVAIEPMLTDQWFVDTAKIVQPAIDAVRDGRTEILPERDAKTYFHWLENIEPWCISRQLWWGHQIPVWYGLDVWPAGFDDDGDDRLDEVEIFELLEDGAFNHADPVHHCAADFDGVSEKFLDDLASLPAPLNHARIVEVADRAAAIDLLAQSLADYNLSEDPTHLVYPVWRDPDVLDTWFSSGLWPIGTLGWPEDTAELARYFPTSVLITGFDIIFFWVARMMMMQLAVVNEVPFKTVYVHALVRDEKGKKMSKSLGNVLDPLELIDEFGADAVRFTLTAMAAMGRDLKLSTARIAGYRNFGTKLWNACRFAEMNGVWESHATRSAPPAATATVNRWIIGETGRVREEVDAALAAYRFDAAANALYSFVWGKVCDWYVEFSKPLFDTEAAAETRATMAWVLDQCMILLHPIMPFVTEELWATTGSRAKMLVHTDWPSFGTELVDPAADREMTWVIGLIEEIRSARAQVRVPAGLKLPVVQIALDEAGRGALARNEALILRLARLEGFTEAASAPKGALTIAVEGGSFAIPLEGVIDIGAEKARLEKTLEKLQKDMAGLRGRLGNPSFVASAPEEVVDEARTRLEQGEEEAEKLGSALARLAEIA